MRSILFFSLISLLLSGCATTAFHAKTGWSVVTNVKEPGQVASDATPTKTGVACSENYLAVASVGDSSIEAAKKAGNITQVVSIDYEIFQVIFYGRLCTVVKGN